MKLPELPYHKGDLAPVISAETMDFHYGKHHQTYIDKLNTLVKGTQFQTAHLRDIVLKSTGGLFNNAAQHWNHSFYWFCMAPKGSELDGDLKAKIVEKWGSKENFQKEFQTQALNNFGSGWTWLVKKGDGLEIVNTSNAANPLRDGLHPLLTVDVWEHAYYIDYRNARAKYLQNFTSLINWKFVQANYKGEAKYVWQ